MLFLVYLKRIPHRVKSNAVRQPNKQITLSCIIHVVLVNKSNTLFALFFAPVCLSPVILVNILSKRKILKPVYEIEFCSLL